MRIRLVRHGEPTFDTHLKIGRNDMPAALECYEQSTVASCTGGAVERLDLENFRGLVVCSELTRAKDSAKLLGFDEVHRCALMNEARLPHPTVLPCTLSWSQALVIFRVAWLFGYACNADGIRNDLDRAEQAAAWLTDIAGQHGDILALGHGIMHRLVTRKLRSQGWRTTSTFGSSYWSCRTIERPVQ